MTGKSVVFDERGLVIDGERTRLIAGEFHYWRVNRLAWGRILDRFVEADVPVVSTFICWDAHERELGRFDFTGETDPALDLPAFMDLCAEKGLQLLIRVGPIIDAFWPTRGPARDVAALERHEEEYRRRTAEYLDHLIPIVAERQATRGGNVIMVCLDNEVYYPYVTVPSEHYEPKHGEIEVTYRRECVIGRWRAWLRERFGTVEALNEACGTTYASFEEIGDPDFKNDPHELTMLAFEHINDSIAESFGWLRGEVEARGVDLPMYCNLRLYTEFIDWHRIDEVVGSSGNQAFSVSMVPETHEHVITWSHMLHRARTRFPWSAEHQAGMCFGLGVMDSVYGLLPPEHFRYAGHLVTALGERATSLTMYVECDWWHWSPVTPVGGVRADYSESVGDYLATIEKTVPDVRLADCGLIWCPEDHQAFVATLHDSWLTLQETVDTVHEPKGWPSWWSTFTRILDDDIDFDLIVPAEQEEIPQRVWVYAGSDGVGLKTLERIAAHVEDGGTLIVTSELPEFAHRGGNAATARARELVAALRQSERVLFASPEVLDQVLGRVGAVNYSRSGTPGVRTYNYVAEGNRDLWIANTTDLGQEVTVELDGPVGAGLSELTENTQLGDRIAAPALDGRRLRLALPAKTVRAFRYAYDNGGVA